MSTAHETDLMKAFYEDMGRNGNPLGTLVDTKQVGDRRSDSRVYVAEVHKDTIIGSLGESNHRGDSVITVWEKLAVRGADLRDRYPFEDYPEVYPRETRSWVKVFQEEFSGHDEAMPFYRELDPETVEDHRENEHLTP